MPLKKIEIDRLPNGSPVTTPDTVDDRNFEQQVKRFIEIADYNPFDGQLHISFFRTCHGGQWTTRILEAIIQELQTPRRELNIERDRHELMPGRRIFSTSMAMPFVEFISCAN